MKKNNNIIILLMGIIIIILAVLCVLFATGTINLKSNNSSQNNYQSTPEKNSEENIENKNNHSSILGSYRRIEKVTSDQTNIFEMELKSDNTIIYSIGVSHTDDYSDASTIMKYSGTYLVENNDVTLTLKSTENDCIDGKYSCNEKLKLTKKDNNNDGIQELLLYDENSYIYSKVDNLYLINK